MIPRPGRSFYPEAHDLCPIVRREEGLMKRITNHVLTLHMRDTSPTRQIDSGPFTNVGSDVRIESASKFFASGTRTREAIVS